MLRRTIIVMAVLAFGGAVRAAPVWAQESPPGCLVNGINVELAKSGQVFRQGDTITFAIGVENISGPLGVSCDVTGASIGFNPPNADGSENQNINDPSQISVLSNQPYLNPSPFAKVATLNYTVNLNPDVQYAYGLTVVRGTLHDSAPHTFAQIGKDLGFAVTNPKLTLSKVGSIQSGQAPQDVTYTYVVRNTSTTPVPMNKVVVSDDLCKSPTYVGGDNGDGLLSNGEAWTYTCSQLLQAPGTYTNTAEACANSTVPGDTTRPVCAPPARWVVTLNSPPPPPPKAAVKGASASKCVTLPTKHLKVRARELTTVKVHVRLNGKNISKSLVHVTGAGVKRSGRTNSKGMVTFHVRPKKSGKLSIKSDQCAVAARVSVKPARQVVSPALPQVTG